MIIRPRDGLVSGPCWSGVGYHGQTACGSRDRRRRRRRRRAVKVGVTAADRLGAIQ